MVIGRSRKGSVRFDVDKPVEVFLEPVFLVRGGRLTTITKPNGLYLRVMPTDLVEVLSVSADGFPAAKTKLWVIERR